MNRQLEFQINENDIIQLVLKYLKQKQFYKAYLSLEQETKVSIENYPKEILFFRQLILDGNFEETQRFITIFQDKFPQKYQEIQYELKKQNFIELILTEPDTEKLIELLKDIEQLTTKENYTNLFSLLTLKNIHSDPVFQEWSYEKSRLQCYETILPIIQSMTYQYPQDDEFDLSIQQLLERLVYLENQHQPQKSPQYRYQQVNILQKNNFIKSDHKHKFKLKINPHQQQLDQSRLYNTQNQSFVLPTNQNQTQNQNNTYHPNINKNLVQSTQFSQQNFNKNKSNLLKQSHINKNNNNSSLNNNPSTFNTQISDSQQQQNSQSIQELVNENMFFMQQSMHLQKNEFLNNSQKQQHESQTSSSYNDSLQQKLPSNRYQNKQQSQSQKFPKTNYSHLNHRKNQIQSQYIGQPQLSNKNEQQFEPTLSYDTQKLSARKDNQQEQSFTQSYLEDSQQQIQQSQLLSNRSNNNNNNNSGNINNSFYQNQQQQQQSKMLNNSSNNSYKFSQNYQQQQQNNSQIQQQQQNDDHITQQYIKENEDEFKESPPQSAKYNKKKLSFHNRCFSFDSGFSKNSSLQNNLSQRQKQQPQFIQNNELSYSHKIDRRYKNKSAVFMNEHQKFGLNNISEHSNSSQEKSQETQKQITARKCETQIQENQQEKEVIIEKLDFMNNSAQNDTPQNNIQQQQQSQFISFNPSQSQQQQSQYSQQQQPIPQNQSHLQQYNNNYIDNFSLHSNTLQESESHLFQNNPSHISQSNNFSQLQQQQNNDNNDLLNYDFTDLTELAIIQDTQPIRTSAFSADGEYFVLGTNSKSLKIYSLNQLLDSKSVQNCITTNSPNKDVNLIFEKKNHHPGSIYTVDWSRSSKIIATGSNDKSIKVLSIQDGDVEALQDNYDNNLITECKLLGHKGIVRTLQINQEETNIYSAGTIDHHIKVWDLNSQKEKQTLQGHHDSIYSIQLGGEGKILASVGLDKKIYIWDLLYNKPIITLNASNYASMNSISLSESMNNTFLNQIMKNSKKSQNISQLQQKNQIVAAHTDGLVTYWDLTTQKLIQEINIHDADCRSVEFDPTANYVTTASFDGTVGIYDIQKGQISNQIFNHSDRVVQARFHPFYPFILTTSADCTSRVFAPKSFLINFTNNNINDNNNNNNEYN